MAFRKELDKELFHAKIDTGDTAVLRVSVHSYNGGEAKFQVGPRTYTKKNGDMGYRKAGRLTTEEVEKLMDILPEAYTYLEGGDMAVVVNG